MQADEVDEAASSVKTPSRPSPKSDSVSMLNLTPYHPRAAGHFVSAANRGNWLDGVQIMWMT